MDYIKSPINYTGNKYRILPQIEQFFPQQARIFVDLFCGGATVGFNVKADHIILVDNNPYVINLLKFLAEEKFSVIIKDIMSIIKKYNLSCSLKETYKHYREQGFVIGNNGLKAYNAKGFAQLKHDYNLLRSKTTKKANVYLYTLMVYGFNNDIRFNSNGDFNLPVGKTDFNKNNFNKLKEYNQRAREINYEFLCADFRSDVVAEKLLQADFIYCDPPYLITDAVYNEKNAWTNKEEEELLNLLAKLSNEGKRFALSNVIEKEGKDNFLLKKWVKENGFNRQDIIYHYRSASYNKINRNAGEQEVLIYNGMVQHGTKDK